MTANTGRADYDQAVSLSALQPGEPIFILKAGDIAAADAIRAWAALAYSAGTPIEVVEMALQRADEFEDWPDRKAADGPKLEPHQRLNLRNQFALRAWAAKEAAVTPDIALAEQRGVSAVLGRLRPLLTDLAALLRMEDGHVRVRTVDGLSSVGVSEALEAIYALAGQDVRARLQAAD